MNEALRDKLNHYVTEMYGAEDAVLKHIQQSITENDMPNIGLQPYEGRLLQMLVEMIGAKKIVEIGTLAGYSGTWMARALPDDGKLITLDVSSKHATVARANFEHAGLSAKVEVKQGDARQILAKISPQAPFDMVFIDADKDNYPHYLEWAIENIRVGGLITAHNAFQNGNILTPDGAWDLGMVEFNKRIAEHPQLSSYIIGVGDGLAVAMKKA